MCAGSSDTQSPLSTGHAIVVMYWSWLQLFFRRKKKKKTLPTYGIYLQYVGRVLTMAAPVPTNI